jgi:carbon monoxide dehydrogenase subunit G
MQIDNEFSVGVPIDRAWEVLTDLEGIAPCLPGAQLTGVNDGVYTGKVKIKVGPVTSEYAGTAKFTEKDGAAHRAVIDARGKDSRGAGTAAAVIHAQLRADGDQTIVSVNTDLSITGRVAQFGSGMIKEISAKLLGQFAQNLEAKLLTPQPADTTAASAPADATAAPAAPAPAPAVSDPAPARTQQRDIVSETDAAPLDLMAVAGSSLYKRAIPLVAAVLALLGVIIYVARRASASAATRS